MDKHRVGVSSYPSGYLWFCSCGFVGGVKYPSLGEARAAGKDHQDAIAPPDALLARDG